MATEIIINQALQSFASPALTLLLQAITFLGSPIFWVFVAAWLFWYGKERSSFMAVTVILFAGAISGGLKQLIMRPRPQGILVMDEVFGYSLPSGHATLAGTAFGFFTGKLKRREKYLVFLLAILVAISRIYLGVHFLSDVLAGLLLGYIIGKCLAILEKKAKKTDLHITKIKKEITIVFLVLAAIFCVFILPSDLFIAQALFGYYIGYALHKHYKFQNKKSKKVTLIVGTIILALLMGTATLTSGITSQITFFIAGLFIPLMPAAITKLNR